MWGCTHAHPTRTGRPMSFTATRTFTAAESKMADDYHVLGMSGETGDESPIDPNLALEQIEARVFLPLAEAQVTPT